MKKLMVLGGSASEVPLIARSLDMGYVTIVVDQDSASPGLKVDGAIAVHASIADKEFVLNCAREHCIDGILPSVDAGVRTAAYVAKQMGLPGISEETAIAGTDKTVMRKVLKEHGIPIPMFRVVSNKEEYL